MMAAQTIYALGILLMLAILRSDAPWFGRAAGVTAVCLGWVAALLHEKSATSLSVRQAVWDYFENLDAQTAIPEESRYPDLQSPGIWQKAIWSRRELIRWEAGEWVELAACIVVPLCLAAAGGMRFGDLRFALWAAALYTFVNATSLYSRRIRVYEYVQGSIDGYSTAGRRQR